MIYLTGLFVGFRYCIWTYMTEYLAHIKASVYSN